MWLFLAFLAVPLIEIALFIQVGGAIGLWPTLAIVVLTAALGTYLVRQQGRMAMADMRRSFSTLDDPARPLAHGAMILFSGALLLTPGFFTDAVGFALLSPAVRTALLAWAAQRIQVARFEMGGQAGPQGAHGSHPPHGPHEPDIIDAEYDDLPPPGKPPHGTGSGWTRH